MAASWPDSTAYSSAVQLPAQSFSDPSLQRARFVPGVMGMPKVRSGQFAQVYELIDGDTAYAVKCFSTPHADRQRRYAAISQTLTALADPAFVEFHYLPSGIQIGGSWFPIVKMAWAEGDLLDQFIEQSLGQRDALLAVADRWRETMRRLEAAGIAHGDLQNGNVKIDRGQIRLIDYDGVYVPALAGQPSGELGVPDFQHPQRSGSDWHAGIDRFSALVIDLSLRAVAADPALWRAFHADPNFLLIQRSDLQTPGATPIWQRLQASKDAEVVRQAEVLAACCQVPVVAVPSMAALFDPASPVDAAALLAQHGTAAPVNGAPSFSGRWWEQPNLPSSSELDQLVPAPAAPAQPSGVPAPVFNPAFDPGFGEPTIPPPNLSMLPAPTKASGTRTSILFWLFVAILVAVVIAGLN